MMQIYFLNAKFFTQIHAQTLIGIFSSSSQAF